MERLSIAVECASDKKEVGGGDSFHVFDFFADFGLHDFRIRQYFTAIDNLNSISAGPSMFQLSVSQFCSYRWTFFQDAVRFSRRGIPAMGVWRRKLDEIGVDEAVDLLDEMRLAVSSLHWAGGFTGSQGVGHVDAIDDAIQAVVNAHQLRAGCLVVHPGGRNGHTDRHARRLLDQALERLVPVALDFGVRLAIEPTLGLAANPWSFITTFDEHLELISHYPIEALGLVLDLYHVGDRVGILSRLPGLVDRIALVQLADFRSRAPDEETRCGLGQGEVPIEAWLNGLDQAGYAGVMELELHGAEFDGQSCRERLDASLDYLASVPACAHTLEINPSRQ